jgi:hypothetical protein
MLINVGYLALLGALGVRVTAKRITAMLRV